MLTFDDIKIGSTWHNNQNPMYKVIVVDVAPRIVGTGGWISYRPTNDPEHHIMKEDSWKFQIAYNPEE